MTVFGRPTHEVDDWPVRAELAATTAPPPIDAPASDAPGPSADADTRGSE